MTELTSEPFYTRQLDAIAPGNLSLDLPTKDGIVQIEGPFEDMSTPLFVHKDNHGDIIVKLATGRPLQAEEIASVLVDDVPVPRHFRLFDEPIEELKFSKAAPQSATDRDIWVAIGENLVVRDINLLKTFVNMIGDHARREQERKRKNTVVTRNPL